MKTSAFAVQAFVLHALVSGLLLCFLIPGCSAQQDSNQLDFELENGLQVSLRRATRSKQCALMVLFDFGNLADPENKSGMAHLAEHLYCTGATAERASRTAEEFFRSYPMGANAQTGDRYTVFATVFEPEQLSDEIDDAAQRMTGIQVTPADLEREIPRMQLELQNMFSAMPYLAGINQGRNLRLPLPKGARRGGLIDELKTVERDELQKWLDQYYKPVNARLILAGPMDLEEAEQQIRQAFAVIKPGSPMKLALDAEASPDHSNEVEEGSPQSKDLEVEYHDFGKSGQTFVTLTFALPLPDQEHYAASLVFAARLQRAAIQMRTKPQEFPVNFTPIDQPQFLSVTFSSDASSEDLKQQIWKWVERQREAPLNRQDIVLTKNLFGRLLGIGGDPATLFANNPYGWAFMVGRTRQLGLDGDRLLKQFEELDQAAFEKVWPMFEPESAATVIQIPKQ